MIITILEYLWICLALLNDANGVTTTFLEEDAKHPPFDIQEAGKGPIPTNTSNTRNV